MRKAIRGGRERHHASGPTCGAPQAAQVSTLGQLLPQVVVRAAKNHEVISTVQRRWEKLVGRTLSQHTRPVGLRRGRLIVHVDRPGDAFTLSYRREGLLERLKDLTKGCVEELVVRAGQI